MEQFGFLSAYDLLVGFIHVFLKGDANGHHKVESVSEIIIFE